jgi:hypothetical protein
MAKKIVDILKPDLVELLKDDQLASIKDEVLATERALGSLAKSISKSPSNKTSQNILNKISKLHAQNLGTICLCWMKVPIGWIGLNW